MHCLPSEYCSVCGAVMQADTLPQIFGGSLNPETGGCYLYGRSFNPTVRYLGRQLAAMEGTEAGYGTSSGRLLQRSGHSTACGHIVFCGLRLMRSHDHAGMSAIACTLLRICNTGVSLGHILEKHESRCRCHSRSLILCFSSQATTL